MALRCVLALALVLSFALPILPARTVAAPTDGSTLPVSRGATGMADPAGRSTRPASSELFTGAATARIPIEVAKGIQGMQPRLVLAYSSHEAKTASWVGAGWSLRLGAVRRSLEEGVPAYDDAEDTFLLNGEELVRVGPEGSASWHTRRESFRKIERVGPYGWDVRTKDGTVSRYGYTAGEGAKESCAIRTPSGDYLAFLLCEREDLHGNRLAVEYDRSDPGVAYPKRITYGGRSVEFVLEPGTRPDPHLGYRAGFRRERTRRLHAIEVRAGGERLRRYELDYGDGLGDGARSLLRAVRLHGVDYGAEDATPPREWSFSYRDGGAEGWERAEGWSVPSQCRFVTGGRQDAGTRLADVNGDALPDLVRQVKVDQSVGNTGSSGVWLNTGSGFEHAPGWSFPTSPPYELPDDPGASRPGAWRNAFVQRENGVHHSMGTLLTDMDADGRADLLVMKTTIADYANLAGGQSVNARQEYLQNTGSRWQSRFLRTLNGGGGYRLFVPADPALVPGWAWDPNPSTPTSTRSGWPTGSAVPGEAFPNLSFATSTYYSNDFSYSPPVRRWSGTVGGTATLAELDGDGRPEILGRSLILAASSYASVKTPDVGITEIREDGGNFTPLDAFSFRACGGTSPHCNRRLMNMYHTLQISTEPVLDWAADGAQRYGKRFLDVNGDGLDDQVTAVADPSASVPKEVLLSNGRELLGPGAGSAWALPAGLYFDRIDVSGISRDMGVRVVDLNGDGRADLLHSQHGSTSQVWLNTGGPSGGWSAGQPVPIPAGMALTDGLGRDRGVRVRDLDGDGRLDLLRCAGEPDGSVVREAYLHRGGRPDLLETVETPLGGLTRFRYASSPEPGQYLPRSYALVERIETAMRPEDGGAPVLVAAKEIDYAGGAFDAEEGEFRGFGEVTVREMDPQAPDPGLFRRTRVAFHQDDARAGLVQSREVRDAEGALWLRIEKAYTEDPDGPPFVSLPQRVVRQEHDGSGGPPRRSMREFEYDAYGNRTETTEWGEVTAGLEDVDPDDTRVRVVEYATNPALHLVGLPARRALRTGDDPQAPGSAKLRETRLFYDGDASGEPGDAPPTEGLLTRKVAVEDFASGSGPTTRYGYDAYGNRTEIRNPRSVAGEIAGSVEIEYGPTFHTFPVLRRNEKGHETRFSYATPDDCGLRHPKGAGLVHVEEGPNDLANGTHTLRCYDAFGRPVLERGPGNRSETRWAYVDVPGSTRIFRIERASESGATRTTLIHKDGLGRTWRVERQGPQGRIVETRTGYDAAGRIVREVAPHFAGDDGRETRFRYDVLDRKRSVDRPGPGRVTTTRHDRGLVTLTEPPVEGGSRARVTERERDAFGRVVRVVEDAEGARHETRYRYDAAGELVRVVDAEGNTTRIRYDALGRKKRLEDPDAGLAQFRYDANGNLRLRIDPQGLHLWQYDALDRPTRRLHAEGGEVATWRYDTAPGGIGRLASREDEAGRYEATAYDALGRATAERYAIAGETLAFTTRYDPLGQRIRRSYPSGRTIEWERDARGFLTAIRSPEDAPYASGIEWDAEGRLVAWEAANGVPTSLLFDDTTGRLSDIEVGAGSELLDLAYDYDAADRLRSLTDENDASRSRSFRYDALDRLKRASGPYGSEGGPRALHYHFDPLGNLTCRASASATDCEDGTELAYPEPGSPRPHAPESVDGEAARYDDGGNLVQLGARDYRYDLFGRLEEAREGDALLARFAYTASGRRARVVEHTGARPVTRHLVSRDFEWDETRGLATIHVALDGRTIAAQVEPFDPGIAGEGEGSAWGVPGLPLDSVGPAGPWSLALGLLPAAAGTALLLVHLAGRYRRGGRIVRPALAGAAAVVLYVGLAPAAGRAVRSDGDLNGDGRLNAADARIALGVARGEREPDPGELRRGDVAPLDGRPDGEPELGPPDVALLFRALRGDDLDGDGLGAAAELEAGASPFRSDTDHDGLPDADELEAGTDPADPDTDGDGLGDAAEVAGPTDATRADTDGDGSEDGSDAAPRTGARFLHADHLGSSVVVTGADGEALERVTYRPFGGTVSGSPPPQHGFTGQRFETSVGIYDYGARWYDPRLGRFLQPDSMVPEPGDPQSLNRYSYVRNNPLGRIDPTGHFSFSSVTDGFADFFRGFGRAFATSFDVTEPYSGPSSSARRVGTKVGATAGILSGVGLAVLSTPVTGLAAIAGGLPVLGNDPNGPVGTVQGLGDDLYAYGINSALRADDLSGDGSNILSILNSDVGGSSAGGAGHLRGFGEALGATVQATLGGQFGTLDDALGQWAKSFVPRHGAFAGPAHPDDRIFSRLIDTFNTGPDRTARPHDIRYRDKASQMEADRRLVESLNFSDGPLPGPLTGLYQLGMEGAFRAKIACGKACNF